MGSFVVDRKSRPGAIILRLEGRISTETMQAFLAEHNAAVDACHDQPYQVFVDLREVTTLSPEAAALMERAKAYSASKPNFRGSAVVVASSTVAMQHRRTSVTGGVMGTELISHDEAACWEHLSRMQRTRRADAD